MPADEVYGQLISINQTAFSEGDYDTACHVLEGALARAHHVQDAQSLGEIRTIAQEQETQLAITPLPERIPGTSDQRRHALRLILASIVEEAATMTSVIQLERELAQRRLASDTAEPSA